MALKDILTNASKYADDMVLTFSDGTTFTVGEMRAMEQEEKQRLITRSQTLEQAEMEFAQRVHAAVNSGVLVPANPQNNFHSDDDLRRAAATTYNLDENDPLLGQVVREMKRIETEANAKVAAMQTTVENKVKELNAITARVTGAYLNDFYATKFNSAVSTLPKEIASKVKYEDVVKFADENRMMDKEGRFNIERAVDMLTWNDVKDYERKQIRSEEKATADKGRQLDSIRPSGIRTVTSEPGQGEFSPLIKEGDRTRTKTLDEALAAAAADDDLWASALQFTGSRVQ